jgi:hypothetical protein
MQPTYALPPGFTYADPVEPDDPELRQAGYRIYSINVSSPSGTAIKDDEVPDPSGIEVRPWKIEWKYATDSETITSLAGNGKNTKYFSDWRYWPFKEFGLVHLQEGYILRIDENGGDYAVQQRGTFLAFAVNDVIGAYGDNSGVLQILVKFIPRF